MGEASSTRKRDPSKRGSARGKGKAPQKVRRRRQEVLLRTSERTTFKVCRQRWDWSYNDRLEPTMAQPALRFGTLAHRALEKRYPPGLKRGPHPAGTFRKLYDAEVREYMDMGFRDEDGTWADAGTLGEAMMNGYIDLYGKDDRYKVIGSEMTFQVPVTDEDGRYVVTYVGTMDAVLWDRLERKFIFRDYKTTKAIKFDYLVFDEQAGSYWAYGPDWLRANGYIKPGERFSGIEFDYLRKAMPDDRPKNADGHYMNKDGSVSKQQPAPLFHRESVYRDEADCASLRKRVIDEAREMAAVRRGELAVYKTPGQMHNPHCSTCAFKEMCELHETGNDWESMRDASMTQWEPYEAHDPDRREKMYG